jgi:hypothetical protein
MGLGKTVITLTALRDLLLDTCEVSKVLVIAPLRVSKVTWPAEVEKWDHLKNLDVSVIVGTKKERLAAINHPALIYMVNRENVKFLVEHYEKNGLRWDFDCIVIDELSSFKNHSPSVLCGFGRYARLSNGGWPDWDADLNVSWICGRNRHPGWRGGLGRSSAVREHTSGPAP